MFQLGLIGEHISHSVSPKIHRALLDYTGLEGHYGILDTSASDLSDLLGRLKKEGYAGVNVTVPHKQAVVPLLDEYSDQVAALQAVNTVVFQRDAKTGSIRLEGHNTDVQGFWDSVPSDQQKRVAGQQVLLLGAGGASRAVIAAVLPHAPERLVIAGQNPARLNETLRLAEVLKGNAKTQISTCDLKTGCFDLSAFQWVINATPIGTGSQESPLSEAQLATLPGSAFISDLVYHPRETQLLALGRKRGLSGQNGLGMLIRQAMAAFMLWTGKALDDGALAAVEKALNDG